MMQSIGILGGTFNPVHCGHIQFANDFSEVFQLNQVHLIPCAIPPHRAVPEQPASVRLALLQAGLKNSTTLVADDVELAAAKVNGMPNYTVNTLRQLRKQYGPETAIYFAMGADAFEHFEQWHDWQEILSLSHIVVIERPGYSAKCLFSSPDKAWLTAFETQFTEHKAAAGIVYLQTFSLLDISSTFIREQLQQGKSVSRFLPDAVEKIIQEQSLYSVKK